MKARPLFLLMLAACLLTTTSCVNFLEKFFIRADGSGSYAFIVDMSQMKSMIELTGEQMDSEQLMRDLDLDQSQVDELLSKVEGISDAKLEFNESNYNVTLSFNFTDIDALNRGLSAYYRDSTKIETLTDRIFFEKKGNSFNRLNLNVILDNFNESLKAQTGEDDTSIAMAKMMMSDSYYQTEIRFEDEIRSFTNDEYQQNDSKSISWTKYFFSDSDNQKDISVKIKLK